jgi:hypothetical protein
MHQHRAGTGTAQHSTGTAQHRHSTAPAFQTHASNASNVHLQVCCVRGGGGRVRVVAVTSIGSPTLLKNSQMANCTAS